MPWVNKTILLIIFLLINLYSFSQCAMCKAVAESDLQSGGTAAKGINHGIIYLVLVPYILIATVGYFIYQHYKKSNLTEK